MAKLSPEVKQRLEQFALGQALTSWGELSYEEVLDSLRNDGQTWNTNDDIVVWLALDGNYAEYIAEHIEDVYASVADLAEYVTDVERASTIEMIRGSLDNPALDVLPAKMALQVMGASLLSLNHDDEDEEQ